MFMRECGAGHELVCMVPSLRHPNRVSERERLQRKAERSLQRLRTDDRKWAAAMADPWTLPAMLHRLARRAARRSRVMYARIARSGGVR
jgi:hypothetical protein